MAHTARRPYRSRRTLGPRSLVTLLTAVFGGFALALGVTGGAQAAPTPAELEQQIDEVWNQLEPIIEQHNRVKSELSANRAKVKQLADQIQPLQVQVDNALGRVSAMSAQYYKTGRTTTLNALIDTGSPATFADQLTLLNVLAKQEQTQIKDVISTKRQYDDQKKPLDELVAKLTAQEAELAAKEKTINAEVKRLNDMRTAAYGSGQGTGELKPVACPVEYTGGPAAKAAQVACNQIGKKYVWGSEGPNTFDCSGLTMYAWSQAGVKKLRHYTKWQFQDTKRVTRAELKPGDLVFFHSDLHHMGLYVGGGWMVHAPTSGDVVRMKKIDSAPIAGYGRVA